MRIHTQPCGDSDAIEHYVDTIENRVPFALLEQHLNETQIGVLPKPLLDAYATWGVTNGAKNSNFKKWQSMSPGDMVLLYRKKHFFMIGRVAAVFKDADLAEALWKRNKNGDTWENMFIMDELKRADIPIELFNEIMGYKANYIVQGYQSIDEERSEQLMEELQLTGWDRPVAYDTSISVSLALSKLAETDATSRAKRRLEQSLLAQHLFGKSNERECGICQKTLPNALLHAAHIKKRQNCTKEERLDVNVVMPLCKMGCDDLFEKGYILIDSNGTVLENERKPKTPELQQHLDTLIGKKCGYLSQSTLPYFLHRYRMNKA